MGNIVTLTGRSASGKTSVARRLLLELSSGHMVSSYTTREPRESDLPHEYRHVTGNPDFFDSSAFAWTFWKGGNRYGTRTQDIIDVINGGPGIGIMMLVPDKVPELRAIVRQHTDNPGAVYSYYLRPPDEATLRLRLRERGETSEFIRHRFEEEKDWEHFAQRSHVPYHWLPPESLDATVGRILAMEAA